MFGFNDFCGGLFYGNFNGIGGFIMMLIGIILLVVIVFFVIKYGPSISKTDKDKSLELLKKKYIDNEIDEEEYRAKRKILEE